jgi:23S rRNA (cytidine1920-2'-O)/16S rRNA (cytidine1409-2'-O)-methyltransferase
MAARQRLDLALVERALVPSREKAQALILAGEVFVDGQKASKPGQAINAGAVLEVHQPHRYVSRGGLKLETALASFSVSAKNKVCLDIGTSTGGFTDCLLQEGALRVHCVDTGAGQIDWKLRTDPRVVLHERTNARYLSREEVGEQVDILVCDVSFISVTLLVPAMIPLLDPTGDLVILIKPQFEVGRENVGAGGIVRDPLLHQQACDRVRQAVESEGLKTEIIASPILGMEGNREFLLHGNRQIQIEHVNSVKDE